jgi:biopolymer transport protein ExbB
MVFSRFFTAGGIVMWPLLAFSVVAISLSVERVLFWLKIRRRQNRLIREALDLYRHEPHLVLEKLKRNIDLPIARIFAAAIGLDDPTPEEFRLALESEAQAELPVLKRFSNLFETIINLSPLLGLLGTVLGLITSFASLNIGDVGGTRTAAVSAGISEALVSTAAGLTVAIITLMFANTFRGLYLRQIALIQEASGQLELIQRQRYERGGKVYASAR